MIKVAAVKRWNSETGTYFVFPNKRRLDGVGSLTVEPIEGTEEFVDESDLDDQGRVVRRLRN